MASVVAVVLMVYEFVCWPGCEPRPELVVVVFLLLMLFVMASVVAVVLMVLVVAMVLVAMRFALICGAY